MRARHPDVVGFVEVDGVRLGYEVFGDGEPTLLLMPTWMIVHSRFWKAQVPYLARHHRVVTYDGPGNGRSDRPLECPAYTLDATVAQAVAVLDATGTERAVVVSLSQAVSWSLRLAADHPDRVLGQVIIAPSLRLTPQTPEASKIRATFQERVDHPQGWEKFNAHYWRTTTRTSRPSSSARPSRAPLHQAPRGRGRWAMQTTPEVLIPRHSPARLWRTASHPRGRRAHRARPWWFTVPRPDPPVPWGEARRYPEANSCDRGRRPSPHGPPPRPLQPAIRDFIDRIARG